MNKEQITFLMGAGYTLEEIMQMQTPQPAPDPQPEPQSAPDPKPEPQPAPDPKPEPQPDQSAQIQQLSAAVAQLTKLVQNSNITGMQFGSPQPERTVNDILAEIINPPGKHVKGGNSNA